MKKFPRILALLLTFCMVVSLQTTTLAAEPTSDTADSPQTDYFDDIHDHWARAWINEMAAKGIVKGTNPDGTHFKPNSHITRAQFVTMLYRAVGEPEVTKEQQAACRFNDLAPGAYYIPAVQWAYANQVTMGRDKEQTRFAPNMNISREQLVTMLYRYSKAQPIEKDLTAFQDHDAVSSWAVDAFRWAVGAKIISGVRGMLVPQRIATRAENAKILSGWLATMNDTDGNKGGSKEINFFGIGDFGGALDDSGDPAGNPGGARIVGKMKALTATAKNPVVVSGGTIYTGSAISETTQGKSVNDMLRAMNVRYAAVGNHDFDWSTEVDREQCFAQWEKDGGFRFLNANVYYSEGEKAGQRVFTPYAVEVIDGVRVGLFGVLDEANYGAISSFNTKGIVFRPAAEAAIEMVKTLRSQEKCDVVIALAHVGSSQDAPYTPAQPVNGPMSDFITKVNAATKSLGGLDGVMGSQTLTPLCGVVDGTPVVKGQNFGRLIDALNIQIDEAGKVSVTGKLYPLTQVTDGEKSYLGSDEHTRENTPVDAGYQKIYDRYNAELEVLMNAPRGISDAAFSYAEGKDRFEYRKWYLHQNLYYLNNVYGGEHVDAYFQNVGGIRPIGEQVIKQGDPINLRLLYRVAPFNNYIVTMDMTGAEIKTMLSGKSQYGTYDSLMQYGFDVVYKTGEFEQNGEIESIQLHGKDVVDDQVYHIAVNTFLSPGPGDNIDTSAGKNVKNTNVLNRNAVLYALLDRSATLNALTLSAGQLDRPFDPEVRSYKLTVDKAVKQITADFTPYDGQAKVEVSGGNVAAGDKTMTITVTSAYGDPYKTPATIQNVYTFDITVK